MRRLAALLALAAPVVGATAGAQKETFGPEEVPVAIDEGLAFLVESQNDDGSWGGYLNTTFTSFFANHATYRMWSVGTSALATRALMELGVGEAEEAAADRGLDFLIANARLKRPAEWDVDNNWAIIYGLDAVSRALQHPRYVDSQKAAELRGAGNTFLAGLAKYQSPRGGWGYYSDPDAGWRPDWATSFMTAVAVLAMQEAKAAGFEVDEKMYQAGVKAVDHARLPNGAVDYEVAAVTRHLRLESINQIKGSLGRIQVANLALWRDGGGLVELDDLKTGLEQFVKHHKFLAVARNKPIPHEAYYANAAYFYLFAHYYASQVLNELPAEEREPFAAFIQSGVLDAKQKDGSMWDFWIASNTKPYGTAFGAMTLKHTTQAN